MRHAQRPIGKPTADGHDHHIAAVVADVVADLFQTAQRGKIGDRIGEHDLPGQGHSGGDAGHVLLGDAGVEKLPWKPLGELLDHAEAKVADDQRDSRVGGGQFGERANECRSHAQASNSAIAFWYSSPCGLR